MNRAVVAAAPLAGPAAPPDLPRAESILAGARRREGVLLEHEGLDVFEALGIAVPRRVLVRSAREIARWTRPRFEGARCVVKAMSASLPHKTEAGAVTVVANRVEQIAAAAREMEARLASHALEGLLVCEFVPHESGPGREFLLGLRVTRDFGPVVSLGAGGVHAEFFARALRPEEALAVFPAALDPGEALDAAIARLAVARLATEPQRGQPAPLPRAALAEAARRLLALARRPGATRLAELEANPLVVSAGRLVALDALGRLRAAPAALPAPRPIARIRRLLEPGSIAIMGVSERMNPGHIILRNVLREGFDPARVTVIKPGAGSLDGVRCLPSLAALPAPVDLLVLSVSAAQAAEALAETADHHRAESVVLIPGGLDEKPGAEGLVSRMRESLARARQTAWGGPVVNGGNCLGLRSRPGRFDTLFIPEHKLPRPDGAPDPLALIAGSGAFAVARTSQLEGLQPLYTLTIGNQMDLTVSDYLEFLADDPRVRVFAIYLEGFRPGDGARFVRLADRVVRSGRSVILYLGGRTGDGAAAAASHTASIAGDFEVARRLARAAGVVVAETLEDFDDLTRLFVRLGDAAPRGLSLGAVTNAGFEAVAIADRLGPFRLAAWSAGTESAVRAALEKAHLDGIVAMRNPLDLTPILGDEGYEQVLRAVLDDPGVDAAVLGIVPLTPALDTLAAGAGHADDLAREDGIARRLARVRAESGKPWIAVVDAGSLYDPLARALEAGGIPTFRAADRATRLFGVWCEARVRP